MTELFKAVTPDGKETEISKVKVRMTEDISEEELATIQKYQLEFQPKSEMYRLEVIDKELIELKQAVTDAKGVLDDKLVLRQKVETAALTVKLVQNNTKKSIS